MAARSKSDISNSAIRIFLQDVGKFYDQARGFEPFGPRMAQKPELFAMVRFLSDGIAFGGRADGQIGV